MVTNIKMEVTPDLSNRIQKIVFANDGKQKDILNEKIAYTKYKYIFIDKDKYMFMSNLKDKFKNSSFEEISAYDFIASQGQQKWLPKFGEKALFSDEDNDGNWVENTFITYSPASIFPFICGCNSYAYCKPIPKRISFVQFLKDNNAYEQYMHNVKIENQRWGDKTKYKILFEIQSIKPNKWIEEAFNFQKQIEGNKFWSALDCEWKALIKENKDKQIVWE